MPSSSSSSAASASNSAFCRDCCQMFCEPCQMISCTPIDALPGHLPPNLASMRPPPRERGRSRQTRGRPPPPPIQQPTCPVMPQVGPFCSPVILSTSTPAESSGGSSSSSLKWRPRTARRRSASNRQRQGASLIRASPQEDTSDNCPHCQPRYSKSPERLVRLKQPQTASNIPQLLHHHPSQCPPPVIPPPLRHKLSYGDLLASKRPPPASAASNLQKLGNRVRRSRSEFRVAQTRMNTDESTNPLNFHLKLRDHNGNLNILDSSEYAEISQQNHKLKTKKQKPNAGKKRVSRSKSRSMSNCGLLTVWPGKTGIWLPQ